MGEDGPERACCELCDGAGEITKCAACRDNLSLVDADRNGGICDSCRIDAETSDQAAEYARIARVG